MVVNVLETDPGVKIEVIIRTMLKAKAETRLRPMPVQEDVGDWVMVKHLWETIEPPKLTESVIKANKLLEASWIEQALSRKNDPGKEIFIMGIPVSEKCSSLQGDVGSHGNITILEDRVLKKPQSNASFPYFIREMVALRLLDKANVPGIIKLLDVDTDGTLVLEKHDGDLIDIGLDDESVIRTIYHILVGMANMQNLHIVHRDIKPDNILSNHNGTKVAICDFGLSRYYPENIVPEQSTPSIQTAYYRAPELMFADLAGTEPDLGDTNPWNLDVWSLGITALRLLNLEDYLIDHDDDDLTSEELYGIYDHLYGDGGLFDTFVMEMCPDGVPQEHIVRFLLLVREMLTIDSDKRPDAPTLLSNPVFDKYRTETELIDSEAFNRKRVDDLLNIIPESETNPFIKTHLDDISQYCFNNVESTRLATCMIYMLPKTERVTVDIETIIALAAAVFDTDVIEMSRANAINLLKKFDYDLMQPVTHPDVIQRLDKLLSIV